MSDTPGVTHDPSPDIGRIGTKQLMDELARKSPEFAAARRKHEQEMKVWRRQRARLAKEIISLEVPFVVAMLNPQKGGDDAGVVLRVADFLYEREAPAELIRDLLRAAKRWLPE
jgi:hypothetical protein